MPERLSPRLRRWAVAVAVVLAAATAMAACSDDDDEAEEFDAEGFSAQCEEFATTLEDPLVYLLEDVDRLEQAASGVQVAPAEFDLMRERLSLLSEQDQRYVTWAACMSNLDMPATFSCGPKDPAEDYLVARNEVCTPVYPAYRESVVENPLPHGPFPDEVEPAVPDVPTTTQPADTAEPSS